jgi:hypothetical protein
MYGNRLSERDSIYNEILSDAERNEYKSSVISMIAECQSRGGTMKLSDLYKYFASF